MDDPAVTIAPSLVRTPDEVEGAAAAMYASGYHCSEAVLVAVNDALGRPMPSQVARLASGEGLGGSRCICGALAGGVMALGLARGRVSPADPWEPAYESAAELRRRWVEDQRATTCEEVVSRIGGMELAERWAHCTELVGRTARWVVELIAEGRGASSAQ